MLKTGEKVCDSSFLGRAEAVEKAYEYARLAGVELKAICFSSDEVFNYIPPQYSRDLKLLKRIEKVSNNCLGFAIRNWGLIYLRLPVKPETVAHEVNHLRTSTSHHTEAFHRQMQALVEGRDPAKARKPYRSK